MMKCILCSSKKSTLIESMRSKDVLELYKRYLKIFPNQLKEVNKNISLFQCRKCGLKYFYPQIVGDDLFYEYLQKFDWYYLNNKDEYHYASRFIKRNDKVLDVGCGYGGFAKLINTKRYRGLEFNEKAIKEGKRNRLDIMKHTVEEHSWKYKAFYNVVCAFQVLEHVQNPYVFIYSCSKCLKKGGKLILSVPSDDSFVGRATNAALNLPPHHQTRWKDSTLSYLAALFNLKIIDMYHEPLSTLHYEWFIRLVISRSIEKKIGKKNRLVDVGADKYFIDAFSFLFAKLLKVGLNEFSKTIFGHSVTVVYEKK